MNTIDIKSLFLGPKAENQDLYENLIVEAIRDNCFLRKNFHPEDKPIISENDKINFQKTSAELKQKLQEILADLKKGVPLYHPRYIGHMHGDLLLPAVVAYFSTILYNSNNVVGESSPATTKMEFDYMRNLCRMVGYKGFINTDIKTPDGQDLEQSWGHLCSGGHVANIEALWVARNMKYYLLSVKLAIDSTTEQDDVKKFLSYFNDCEIKFFSEKIDFKDISYLELFSLPTSAILDLKGRLYDEARGYAKGTLKKTENDVEKFVKEVKEEIDKYSVIELGVHGVHNKIRKITKQAGKEEEVDLPKLYIAKSNHYSWQKAMDIVGIGHANFVLVDMTPDFSMKFDDLKNKIGNEKAPILAVVGILGSSKQGSIDPLNEIVTFRGDLEKNKKSFYFHIDAAYGGYFPSLLWGDRLQEKPKFNGKEQNYGDNYDSKHQHSLCEFLSKIEIERKDEESKLKIKHDLETKIKKNTEKIFPKLDAVKEADSISIDPHKMGYVPYPAGSILYKETRSKDFISYEPSYLNKPSEEGDEYNAFIGQWTLEGSRPGATAAACYLSNQLLPFNQEGYGLLVKNTFQMANLFMYLIDKFNNNNIDSKINRGYRIFPMYEHPETNIVEYVLVNSKKIKEVKYLNILTEKLYEHFSVNGKTIIPSRNFMVAKEDFKVDDIHDDVWKRLKKKGDIDKPVNKENEEVIKPIILSSVFMNPLSIYIDNVEDYYYEFFKEMVEYADDIVMPEIVFKQIIDNNEGNRLKILWIENEADVKKTKDLVLYKSKLGKYFDIDFCELPNKVTLDTAENKVNEKNEENEEKYQVIILDLNLTDDNHNEATSENTKMAKGIYDKINDNKKSKVIFCSKFFKENPVRINEILDKDFDKPEKSRRIEKPENGSNVEELNALADSIIYVYNKYLLC